MGYTHSVITLVSLDFSGSSSFWSLHFHLLTTEASSKDISQHYTAQVAET